MIKHCLKYLIFTLALAAFFVPEGKAQLIGTGLVEDPERAATSQITSGAQLKTAATIYTDTLQLPFFEDFTDIVVRIDSIVIDNTTDAIVRVYDNVLNSYPDTTIISIGFTNPSVSATANRLARTRWYIKKVGPNQFLIDSSALLTTPMTINADTVLKTAFWRLLNRRYSTTLDSLKWVQSGGTYINNRFPVNPVSYNVATFDGLNANGIPYNTTNVQAKGFADNLTSLPINLKSYTAADNIFLSFFWQQAGVGETPETEDYLQLEFKDSTGSWNVIQTISGNLPYMDTFKIAIVPVTNPIYFSKHFQFRFRSFGRLSGPFDIWNLDHIYLNNNRNINDTLFNDKSVGNVAATFLTRYTAMPYPQYFANKAAESGYLTFTDNNLGRGIINSEFFNVIGEYTRQPDAILFSRDTSRSHFPGNILFPLDNARTFQDTCTPVVTSLANTGAPFYIDQTLRIPANDTANILFANNNRYNNITVLWDYYAYDDGSPEWGVAADQQGAKIANLFTLNSVQDTITHIDIYFTRSKGPDMTGRSILLSVWNKNKTLMSQQVVQVGYGGYKRYKLNTPVIVPAGEDCYVGYQQNFGDLLTVGYDKNYDHSDKVLFNLGGSDWNFYNQQPGYVKGSMMIRPVFSKNQILVVTPVIDQENEPENAVLYPVPANDLLKIQGRITKIALYDLTGHKLCEQAFDPFQDEKEINTAHLSNGIYIAELSFNQNTQIKKIIVQH